MLVACDIYRPAAIQQLKVVGEQAGVPVFEMGQEKPYKIYQAALKEGQKWKRHADCGYGGPPAYR